MSGTSIHSVIHEFEVLYSNRIIQKDKKWNDGKLRYYEFNGKLEIVNEDENIIATDFNQLKNHKQFLQSKLAVNNQFTLSNNKLIIEIIDKLSTYERDVVLNKKATQVSVKVEPTNSVRPRMATPSVNGNFPMLTPNSLGRRIGLQRTVKLEPKSPISIKLEHPNFIATPLPSHKKPRLTKVKSEPLTMNKNHVKSIKPITRNTPQSKSTIQSKPRIRNHVILKNSNILRKQDVNLPNQDANLPKQDANILKQDVNLPKEDSYKTNNQQNSDIQLIRILRDRTNILPRIPPYSSRIFKHRSASKPHKETSQTKDIKVKQEMNSIQTTKSLENADIIYDLSDFEEDERFLSMLEELKRARDSPNATENAVKEVQTPSKNISISPVSASKINEAHDFDLSSNSDFDDIDLG